MTHSPNLTSFPAVRRLMKLFRLDPAAVQRRRFKRALVVYPSTRESAASVITTDKPLRVGSFNDIKI